MSEKISRLFSKVTRLELFLHTVFLVAVLVPYFILDVHQQHEYSRLVNRMVEEKDREVRLHNEILKAESSIYSLTSFARVRLFADSLGLGLKTPLQKVNIRYSGGK